MASYKQARDFAVKYLGATDTISQNLSKTFEKAQLEIETKLMKVRAQEEKMQRNRSGKRAASANKRGAFIQQHTLNKPRRTIGSAFSP